jgi:hypothetical protein
MSYLLNLPLAIAIAAGAWFTDLIFMPQPANWDKDWGIEFGLIMMATAAIRWASLAIVLTGCAAAGRFNWLPLGSRGARIAVVLGSHALLGALSFVCVVTASATSNVAPHLGDDQGPVLDWAARTAATVVPFVVMAWAAWLINAPAQWRGAALPRRAAFGALAITAVTGTVLYGIMLRESVASSAQRAQFERQAGDARTAEARGKFAALTDADPLFDWNAYTGYNVPGDLRESALRKLASRPTLEADLSEALGSPNPLWVEASLSLVASIPFKPSSALELPVRNAIHALAADVRASRTKAYANESEVYVDLYYTNLPNRVLAVAEKMAESAGVDLRDAVAEMQSAVTETYPKSDTAKTYPRAVAASGKRIDAGLAGWRKRT